jgi:hypothetical protein
MRAGLVLVFERVGDQESARPRVDCSLLGDAVLARRPAHLRETKS